MIPVRILATAHAAGCKFAQDEGLAMLALSQKTERLLALWFSDDKKRIQARAKLAHECGNNIPSCETSRPEQMDRIRFAAIKLSDGDLEKLDRAIALAKTDWRDLLMAADFGQDIDQHNKWYVNVVEK